MLTFSSWARSSPAASRAAAAGSLSERHTSASSPANASAQASKASTSSSGVVPGVRRPARSDPPGHIAPLEVIPWPRQSVSRASWKAARRPACVRSQWRAPCSSAGAPGRRRRRAQQLAMPGRKGREVEASEVGQGSAFVPHAPALVVARVPKGDEGLLHADQPARGQGRLGQAGLAFQGVVEGQTPIRPLGRVQSSAGLASSRTRIRSRAR